MAWRRGPLAMQPLVTDILSVLQVMHARECPGSHPEPARLSVRAGSQQVDCCPRPQCLLFAEIPPLLTNNDVHDRWLTPCKPDVIDKAGGSGNAGNFILSYSVGPAMAHLHATFSLRSGGELTILVCHV